jgi:four helix bundle protein
MSSYRELRVWRQAIDLVVDVYCVSATFPSDERFGLTTQLRRASVSIAANIAEGHGRPTIGERLQFLGHARGSLYEVETHLEIVSRLGFVNADEHGALNAKKAEIARGLAGLIRSNEARQPRKPITANR